MLIVYPWQLFVNLLTYRCGLKWGKKECHDYVGQDGGPIQLKVDIKAKLRNKINEMKKK